MITRRTLAWLSVFMLILNGLFLTSLSSDVAAAPKAKTGICHTTGDLTKPYVFIEVSGNAVPAHAAHGDIVGVASPDECPGPEVPVTCGYLTGTVRDSDGNAIPDATVSVAGLTTTSDANGAYAFADCIEQGEYSLTASASGFYDTTLTAAVVADTTVTADVTLERTPTCGSVSGVITDSATGFGIAGATVSAGGQTTTTDADGNYWFDCIEAGDVTVSASAGGYNDNAMVVTVVAGEAATANIALDPVPTCGYLSGTITDSATGLGIAGATVGVDALATTTDANGAYAFTDCLGEGDYSVSASADGYTSDSTTVTIVAGSTVNADIALEPAPVCGSLSGLVTDSSTGDVLAGATVSVDGTAFTATTDAAGNFSIDCLPAGDYTLTTTAAGFSQRTDPVTISPGLETTISISLVHASACEAGATGPITIVLTWGATPSDLDSHLAGPGNAFHVAYYNQTPVSYASLDVDDTTSFGPETVTIDPTDPGFVAGTYHYWIHNFSRTTFEGSQAVITISQCDSQLAQYAVTGATGDQTLDIWDVATLDIDANGNVTLAPIQVFKDGDQSTIP